MYRAIVRDLQESLTLLIRQVADQQNLPFDPINQSFFGFTAEAILGMHLSMRQSDLNVFQWPSFSVGIHTKCHAGACTECCEEKFMRIWTGIAATCLDRLVRLDSVLSDRDVLQISSTSRHDRHISRHFEIPSGH
jgi:hypothetical protein